MKCIITGCSLVDTGERWVSGDLFDAGTHYVFNGNYNNTKCVPQWVVGGPIYGRQLHPISYWERRGVFVILKEDANLNEAAKQYIGS